MTRQGRGQTCAPRLSCRGSGFSMWHKRHDQRGQAGARKKGAGLWRRLGRFRRSEEGATAVEFALLATPLFILLLGIIEVCLFFASGLVLEGGVAEAGRLIRTGQVQNAGDPKTMFETALCDHVNAMLDCGKLQYQVIHITGDTFGGAVDNEPEFDADGNLKPEPFDAGNSNDIILIRAIYRYTFLTPFIGAMLSNHASDNSVLQMSTAVIKAEPYVFGEN